jgi:hypothetical protein
MAKEAKDEGEVVQQTFDWTKDEYGGEVQEGVKFDPEQEYTLELVEVSGKTITSNGKQFNIIETQWAEETSDVKLKQSFFTGRQTINVEKPEKSSPAIVLANALGIKVGVGDKFHVKQILKMGMKIKAHIVPQKNKKGEETGFSVIDLSTARKASGGKAQKKLDADPKDIVKYQTEISGGKYSTKEKFIGNLAQTGRASEIAPFLALCEEGLITFG